MLQPRSHEATKGLVRVQPVLDDTTERLMAHLVDAAYQVHMAMGPGLLEKIYEECFACELADRKIAYVRQAPVTLTYRNHALHTEYKIDLLVEGSVVVELKACRDSAEIHKAQILSYMKLLDARAGLLINFQVPLIKDGIKRFVR